PLERAGDRADHVALHALEVGNARILAGQDDVGEGEVRNGETDGLGALQRVGRRCDADIGPTRYQRGNAIRERRLDIFRRDAQRCGEVVAVVNVEADRIVV